MMVVNRRRIPIELIHACGSLCTTTTCRPPASVVHGLSGHPRGSQRVFYTGSCKWTSENSPSETVWKSGIGPEWGLLPLFLAALGPPFGSILSPQRRAPDALGYF